MSTLLWLTLGVALGAVGQLGIRRLPLAGPVALTVMASLAGLVLTRVAFGLASPVLLVPAALTAYGLRARMLREAA